MHFTDQDLRAAVSAGALDANRLNPLLDFLNGRAADSPVAPAPRFDLAHLLWYAGALIVMGAMGLFSTLAFSAMGGYALAATALAYAVVFTAAGHYLWHHKNLRVPGGLLIAIAVSMAPLAVYGIQDALGLWGHFGRRRHRARLLCLDQRQLAPDGDRRHRRGADRAVALSVSLHRADHRVRALVHVDGPDAVDLRPQPSSPGTSAASCRSGSASPCWSSRTSSTGASAAATLPSGCICSA